MRGDARTLARAVSLVEDGAGECVAELLAACRGFAGEWVAGGSDGSSGGGEEAYAGGPDGEGGCGTEGQRVGIVAVDPSSPYTGGALLGDRIRMQGFAEDAGVYIPQQ